METHFMHILHGQITKIIMQFPRQNNNVILNGQMLIIIHI